MVHHFRARCCGGMEGSKMRVGTKCQECEQTHPYSGRGRVAGKRCIYHDPDTRVDARLKVHRGLPNDCPGCLGHDTIERRKYGKGDGTWKLTCGQCQAEYFWNEGKEGIPK